MSQTKGEALMKGIDQLREGLSLINGIGGNRQDFIKLLVTSPTATTKLRDIMKDNVLMKTLVFGMVASRNKKLAPGTVENVISDFLDVLFDMSQPMYVDSDNEDS
jgi:hypothetical protein